MKRPAALATMLALVAGCAAATAPGPTREPKPPPDQTVFGGARPVELLVPSTYDHAQPTTLVLVLHGLGAEGWLQAAFFGLDRLAEEEGALVLAPTGTPMPNDQWLANEGAPFWNATDVCCDFAQTGVDDAGYLAGLVRDVIAEYNVDEGRVFVVGHSNGGFMAYRLACEHAELFAGVVSVAGATFDDPTRCAPSRPVSVLQIHGTEDDIIYFEGEEIGGYVYPSATKTVESWGGYDGCTGPLGPAGAAFEIELTNDGPETTARRFTGCPERVDAELWAMTGEGHVPAFGFEFRRELAGWFASHARVPAR